MFEVAPSTIRPQLLSPGRASPRVFKSRIEQTWVAVLLCYCGFLFFYGLSVGELWRTESLRAIIAAEFLRSGNWIVPTLYGEPLLTKPPGIYAAIALASWPFGGVSEWTARLPSALAATATVFWIFCYFRRTLDLRAGLVAAFILPASFMWLDKATSAEIDMLQAAWVSAAILCLLRALEAEENADGSEQSAIRNPQSAIPWWFAALLCVAGGVLTKWTAPVFFYATVIPLLWWRGRLRLLWGWHHLASAAVGAGLCLAWAAAAISMVGWDVFAETVGREASVRLSPGLHQDVVQTLAPHHHSRWSPWLSALVHPFRILAANLPWSVFALLTLRPGFMSLWDERGRRLLQALHCWTWPNLVFWSVVPEHALRHSFPLFPGIAGLAAFVWIDWLRRVTAWKWRLRPMVVLATLLGVWLVVKLVHVHAVVPTRDIDRQPRAKGEQLAAVVPADQTLYLFRLKDEGIMFYYGRAVRRLSGPTQLPSSRDALYCILTESEWREWPRSLPAEIILRLNDEQGDPIVLVRANVKDRSPELSARSNMNSPFVPQGVKILTVSELTAGIKGLLEDAFPNVWVAGEVSNLVRPSSGHVYLTLKDSQSQLRGVMWRGMALRLRFDLRDGQEIFARGRLSVYHPRGDYQLLIEELHPKGMGALELALRQLREKLFRLGYFDPRRKKKVPAFPKRLALVTSPTGAAIRDMLEILVRRWPAVEVWVCPVRVQGDGAALEVAAAIRLLNRLRVSGALALDVMIVGRGGGSLEDLWAFNEECVAQAIYESRIPIISAVGHEIDVTIADLVADVRALTPSEAATRVVPDREELHNQLRDLEGRLGESVRQRLALTRERLNDLAGRRVFRLPLERVRSQEQRLDDWAERLGRAVRQRCSRAREQIQAQAARLESLSPLNVLSRGYSLTRREEDQAVVRNPAQVQQGDRLITTVQHGRIVSRVEELPVTNSIAVP